MQKNFIFFLSFVLLSLAFRQLNAATFIANDKNLNPGFTENKGQFLSSDPSTANTILFKAELKGFDLYILEKGLSYVFYQDIRSKNKETKHQPTDLLERAYYRVDMSFTNGHLQKENILSKTEVSAAEINYYYPHCKQGIKGVKKYKNILFKDVYPHIDWSIYITEQGDFKYDFIVHPGGDPNQISIDFKNAQNITILNDQIQFKTPLGNIQEEALKVFQNGKNIAAHYIQKNNTLSYQILKYDRTTDLIIDPQLKWSTFLGGSDSDSPLNINTDQKGNLFITGYTYSSDFPSINPNDTIHSQSISDCFILKFDTAHNLVWATYLGGTDGEWGTSISINSDSNVYVVGTTESSDFPVLIKAGAYNNDVFQGGPFDLFICKFTNTGTLQWSTFYGGDNYEWSGEMLINHANEIFIPLKTMSSNIPVIPLAGAFSHAYSGAIDYFILNLDTNDQIKWSTYVGEAGSSNNLSLSLTEDEDGNLFASGTTENSSNSFPIVNLPGAYNQASINGGLDAFIMKFDTTKNLTWSTFFGGNGDEFSAFVKTGTDKKLYMAGATTSLNINTLNCVGCYFDSGHTGSGNDLFVTLFDSLGSNKWSTYYGGGRSEDIHDIDFKDCSLFITGKTESADFPIYQFNNSYIDNSFGGLSDIFLVKINDQNNIDWSTFYGGNDEDFANSMCFNKNKLFVTGETYSFNFDTLNYRNGAFYQNHHSIDTDDGFILRFDEYYTFRDTITICSGDSILIHGVYRKLAGQYDTTLSTFCFDSTSKVTLIVKNGAYPFFSVTTCQQSFNFNGQTFTSSGTYLFPYMAANGCDSIITLQLTIIPFYTSTLNAGICSGQTYNFNGTILTTTGTYKDTVPSNDGCDSVITLNLNVNNSFYDTLQQTICSGKTYNFHGQILNTAGTYHDTIVLQSGCDSIFTLILSILPNTQSTITQTICSGKSYNFNGNLLTQTGTYSDTLVSSIGCDSVITLQLTVTPPIQNHFSVKICPGETYTFEGRTIDSEGTYTDTLQTALGCDSILILDLIAVATLDTTINVAICKGTTYDFNGVTLSVSGTYYDTIQSSRSCDSVITLILSISSFPVANMVGDTHVCENEVVQLAATGGSIYIWSTGETTETIQFTAVSNVTVSVVVFLNTCRDTATRQIIVSAPLQASAGNDISSIPGNVVTLDASGGDTYNWINTQGLSCTNCPSPNLTVTQKDIYCVEVSNGNACKDTACVNIEINCGEVFVANIFSPNGDGNNDVECVLGNCINTLEFSIYDRWGELVFETTSRTGCWDGTFKEKPMPAGVFFYKLQATLNNGDVVKKHGDIALTR